MGGRGSGQYYRGSTRTTCEEVKRIDIRYLRKNGLLQPNRAGSLSRSTGGEPTGNIRYTLLENEMTLKFKARGYWDEEWESIEQRIWFDRTPCHYGGLRKWFICPRCDARVAVLYGADKISKKLEADEYTIDGDLYKTKGMHWRTFYRLKMAEIAADGRTTNAFLARYEH
jgi:hypothetical protein